MMLHLNGKRCFLAGAAGYPLLELLWRGRTHYSMALAGGLSCMLIGRASRLRWPLIAKALLCGAGVTAVEYACGRIWNRRYRVWDYRRAPLNYQGQICLGYSLLWCVLSGGLLALLPQSRAQFFSPPCRCK